MLYFYVAIYIADKTFSENKDLEFLSKTQLLTSVRIRILFLLFFRGSHPFSTWAFGFWEFQITLRLMWANSTVHLVEPVPSYWKMMWEQLWQNLSLCCELLKRNQEFPVEHTGDSAGDKRRRGTQDIFNSSSFYWKHIKGVWEVKWLLAEQNYWAKKPRESKLRKAEVIGWMRFRWLQEQKENGVS